MVSCAFVASLLALAATAVASPLTPRNQPKCVEGVLIVAARGSDPNWTHPDATDPAYAQLGGLRTIGDKVIQAVGQGSYISAVPYPASINFTGYPTSLGLGIDAAQNIITNYVNHCKYVVNPRIVVLGFSQGAQVISSALAGGDNRTALPSSYAQYIAAGALFGDPTTVVNIEPLDAGNATHSGTAARPAASEQYLDQTYGQKIRSYCEAGDAYCDSGTGANNKTIHLAEVQTWTTEAEQFLIGTLTHQYRKHS